MGKPLNVSGLRVPGARGRVILEIDSLSVRSGQSLGIRGPSGAGKSTLLYALAGLIENAEGQVTWGDTEILGLSPDRRGRFRAAHMGFVFQDFLLFEELSALGNAALPSLFAPASARAAIAARGASILQRLGIDDATRGVDSFSGGERQRVALARALANKADILLADEPTASLHRDAANRLIGDFSDMVAREGRTLIAVSHDEALLSRMDRVITIADGRLQKESGT